MHLETARSLPEAPRRHPEAPRRHPGSTQEAPRRHPGGRGHLGVKMYVFICVFFSKSDAGDHFRVDGSDVTITVLPRLRTRICGRRGRKWALGQYLIQKIHRQNPYR